MNVLVTGGLGFIGGRLSGALLDAGFAVRCVDNLSGSYAPGRGAAAAAGLAARGAELAVEEARAAHVRGADAVIHLAALPGVRTRRPPSELRAANVELADRLARAAAARGARFVLVSSSSVYGNATRAPHPGARAARAAQPLRGEQGGGRGRGARPRRRRRDRAARSPSTGPASGPRWPSPAGSPRWPRASRCRGTPRPAPRATSPTWTTRWRASSPRFAAGARARPTTSPGGGPPVCAKHSACWGRATSTSGRRQRRRRSSPRAAPGRPQPSSATRRGSTWPPASSTSSRPLALLGFLPRQIELLLHGVGLVRNLQPLLEDGYRLVRPPRQPQRLPEVEQRVGVVQVARAGRERVDRLAGGSGSPRRSRPRSSASKPCVVQLCAARRVV